jgi:hypothetical protein
MNLKDMAERFGEEVSDKLERIGRVSSQNLIPVSFAVAVTSITALLIAVLTIQMSMGMTLYIDDSSETAKDWNYLKENFDTGNNIFVVVESDTLHSPQSIKAIHRIDKSYSDITGVQNVMSLADIVRLENNGEIPDKQSEIDKILTDIKAEDGEMASILERIEPQKGKTIVVASYGDVDTYDRGVPLPTRDAEIIYKEIKSETEFVQKPADMSITITGQPVFENAAFGLMLPEMITLFAGSFTVILAVVFSVMRKKVEKNWHVLISLSTAMTSIIYMVGVMGLLGYDFNAIMLGVMPIALGLGIDYSLQIHTRYAEARRNGLNPEEAAAKSTRTTGRALLIAMGTTVAGLLSLLISQVPPVRQFGITSASSIIAAMILSVTILPALLVKFDSNSYQQGNTDMSPDKLESIVSEFTKIVILKKPIIVIGVTSLLVLGGMFAYPSVEPNQEMMDFWPQELDEKKDIEMLSETVESPKVVYVIAETDTAYSAKTFRELSAYQDLMLKSEKVNSVQSPVKAVAISNGGDIPDRRKKIKMSVNKLAAQNNMIAIESVSDNSNSVLMKFYVDDIEGEPVRTLIDEFDGNAEQTLTTVEEIRITGKPVVNRNVIENVTAGLTPMTLLSFTLGILFLSIIFVSVSTALKLVISVSGVTVLLVAGSMYIINIPWNPLTITMSSLALGIGIDFGIHIYERYIEELENGESAKSAISISVSKLSRPILGSSLTTIFGFGVLNVSRFPVLSNFGLTTDFAIAFSLISAFVVLPAVLIVSED